MIDEIVRAKPPGAKGRYLRSVTLTSSMGPGIKLDTARTTAGEVLAAAGVIEDPEDVAEAGNGAGSVDQPEPEAEPAPSDPEPEPEGAAEDAEPEDAAVEPEEPAEEPDDGAEEPEDVPGDAEPGDSDE